MGVMTGSWELNQETDGDVNESPYGTITFENTDPGRVLFTIDLEGILDGSDIHEFGFESLYSGPLSIDPTSIGAADFTVSQDSGLPGLGGVSFDYVVSFDNGTPVLEPLTFSLYSTSDTGFDAADLLNAPTVNANGYETQVAVHAQRTSTPAGSETLVSVQDNLVPEAPGFAGFAMILAIGLIMGHRRHRAK